MEPGDLILTPSWAWHDHGNDTGETVVWMDGLDIPLVASLDAMFFQFYDQFAVPDVRPANSSSQLHGHAALNPSWVKERKPYSPLLRYSWSETWAALSALRDEEGDPYDGIVLEYTNPQTGGPVLPSIACSAQLLRPGQRLKAHRHTGSAVYHVVRGEGVTVIDGQAFNWTEGSIFALPSWALHEHANTSASQDAVLFSFSDTPVLAATGLYREEVSEEQDGHQMVTTTFAGS